MSYIGKNIRKIRGVKKLSQTQFADLFDIARTSVGAYEEERAEPKIDKILEIANYFGVSVDVLLTKELTINDLYNIDIVNRKLSRAHKLPDESSISSVPSGVPFVNSKTYVEYIVQHKQKDFLNQLPRINLPVKIKGTVRAFEMSGSEMEYHQQGLHHGDILMCHQISQKQLKVNMVVLVVSDDLMATYRVKSIGSKNIIFSTDDPNYPDQEIELKKVHEFWEVKGVFTTYLNPPKVLEEKVMVLEKRLGELEKRMNKP